jgi:NADH-quinone oxidoreductase subunit E
MSWEEVECMGACVNAPMVMIGKDTYEDLTVERFEEIVDAFAAGNGASIKPGPQIDRQFSAPEGGPVTLTTEPTAERTYKPFPPPPAPAPAPGAAAAAPAPTAPPPSGPAPASAAAAGEQKPNMPGRKTGEVPEEAAPAIKEPKRAPKVSPEKADSEREKFDASAKADGKPNNAMREDATGAESPAGKRDAGKAPGKGGN